MKIFKRIMLSICLVFSATMFWACGKEDAKVTEIYFKEGTVNTSVEQFDEYSTRGIIIVVKYSDGTEKEITSGVSYSQISTNSYGEKTLTATYEGVKCETTITVTPFDGERPYYVTGVFQPDFIETFAKKSSTKNEYDDQLNATKVVNGETKEKVKGFKETGKSYKVGNDNPFKFSPTISVIFFDEDRDSDPKFSAFPIAADVYKHNGTSYQLISAADLADYVTINADLHTFQFTDLAAKQDENKFKIEVRPDFEVIEGDGRYAVDTAKNRLNSVSFEFEVVDGYNVYNAKELSVIDNSNDNGKWTSIKSANGLVNVNPNAVILHNDIDLASKDIPSVHFYSDTNNEGYQGEDLAKVKGLMINEDNYVEKGIVYKRVIQEGGSFTLEGNYHTISAQNLPLVYDEGCEEAIAVVCTTLFGFIDNYTEYRDFQGDDRTRVDIGRVEEENENCLINNVAFIGNSKKDETTGPAGLCCYKTENVNFEMNNCLSQAWYISHFFEGSSLSGNGVTQKLVNCTSFDSFNTILYCQGARNVIIEDSYLIGAGGPVMICDEEVDEYDFNNDGDKTDEGEIIKHETNVTSINSKLESWLVGEESWFIQTGAGILFSQIKAMESSIASGTGLSIVNGQAKTNVISVFKSTKHIGDALTSYLPINGSFNVDAKNPEEDDYEFGLDFSYAERALIPLGVHALQTFTGALISGDATPEKPLPSVMLPIGYREADAQEIFMKRIADAKDYLGIYVANGMGAVLGASKVAA